MSKIPAKKFGYPLLGHRFNQIMSLQAVPAGVGPLDKRRWRNRSWRQIQPGVQKIYGPLPLTRPEPWRRRLPGCSAGAPGYRRRARAGAAAGRDAHRCPVGDARHRVYPESLMDLGEQELRLQIAHRRTETTVRSGAEWHEGQVRPCRHDVGVVEPHQVVRCGFAQCDSESRPTQVAVSSR
jgi:hypothetical protein